MPTKAAPTPSTLEEPSTGTLDATESGSDTAEIGGSAPSSGALAATETGADTASIEARRRAPAAWRRPRQARTISRRAARPTRPAHWPRPKPARTSSSPQRGNFTRRAGGRRDWRGHLHRQRHCRQLRHHGRQPRAAPTSSTRRRSRRACQAAADRAARQPRRRGSGSRPSGSGLRTPGKRRSVPRA